MTAVESARTPASATGTPMLRGLGYLGLTAVTLDEWRRFGVDILGMQGVDGPRRGTLDLRLDDWAWRLRVEATGAPSVRYLGWEAVDDVALETIARRLEAAGATPHEDAATAAERGVARLVVAHDPDGNRVEFFHTASRAATPFASPQGVRFVTGAIGLGHVFLAVGDEAAAQRFWVEPLGMRVTDTIALSGTTARFFHVNPRHHCFAFSSSPRRSPGIGHLMVEVDAAQHVVDAYDRLVASGAVVGATLGKHTNDHMFSFYAPTPSGIDIEYGSDGRLVDDASWTPGHYDSASVWGHERSVPRPGESGRAAVSR